MNPLVNIIAACSIAGLTAAGIALIPLLWHPPREPITAPFNWPEQPLAEPSSPPANVLAAAGDVPIPETTKKVAVQIYRAVSEQPKTEPKAEPARRDYCYPGHKVDYGRHWRCRYDRRHRR